MPWWPQAVSAALQKAGENRPELERALNSVEESQRGGMAFLIANMPARDLLALSAAYLLENCKLAHEARESVPWGREIPEEIFFNNVLPYANLDEKRENWRKALLETVRPMVRDCKTPGEAALKINRELFTTIKVKYSTGRRAPNQAPGESMETGTASCTGLSIILSDACRAVCVPTRIAGTPRWTTKRGNHTWVEVWDQGWHFTGAAEPDPGGLDRGWFAEDASKALEHQPEHAIYAASFAPSGSSFPLAWAASNHDVPGINVTGRYAATPRPGRNVTRVYVRVTDSGGRRTAARVEVLPMNARSKPLEGRSRDESADGNDMLGFDLLPETDYTVRVGNEAVSLRTKASGQDQTITIPLK